MKRLFNYKEIAEAAGVSRNTVYRYSSIFGIAPDVPLGEKRSAFSYDRARELTQAIRGQISGDGAAMLRDSLDRGSHGQVLAAKAGRV